MRRKFMVLTTGVLAAGVLALTAACGGGDDSGDDTADTPDSHGGGMTATEMPGHGGSMDDSMDGSMDEVTADVTIEVEAKDTRFVPDDIEVPAGKTVRLILKNSDAGTDHDLQAGTLDIRRIEGGAMGDEHGGGGALALHASEGESSEIVFVADLPGTYDIFCTVDDHKDQGMVGRIRVV